MWQQYGEDPHIGMYAHIMYFRDIVYIFSWRIQNMYKSSRLF